MRSNLYSRAAKALVRGPVVSLSSQVVGLLQLTLLLLLHGGATAATDTYTYLFSVGLTPVLILVTGMMYPLLLNRASMSEQGLRRVRVWSPVLGGVFILGGSGWLAAQRELDTQLITIAGIMVLNVLLQGRLYFRAVAAEAGGDPLWISGIALPANAAACVVLLFPWGDSATATTAMVSALVLGNALCLAVMATRRVGHDVLVRAGRERSPGRAPLWFLGKASVGYLSQIVLSSLAVLLPPSTVTVLFIATKAVSAVSTTLTNALMPAIVHQGSESPASARRFLRILIAGIVVAGVIAVTVAARYAPSLLELTSVIALWALAASAVAVAQRTSFRFLPASAAGNTIVAVATAVALTAAASLAPGFDLIVLLCGYAAADALPAALLLRRLEDRAGMLITTGCLAGLSAIALAHLF